MTYQFTVSPSIAPSSLAGWHLLNTWLQKELGEHIHLELYNSFESQREAILSDKVDLIYANPFDAALLAREKGFIPIARPTAQYDEAILAVSIESGIKSVEELSPGCNVNSTDAPHVKMIGMIMLEPADISLENINYKNSNTYVGVAKELIRGTTDVGIFLAETYDKFSRIITQQLVPLVRSDIQVIGHALLISPKLLGHKEKILEMLLNIENYPLGISILESLELKSWQRFEDEDMEFMIDLVSTLTN